MKRFASFCTGALLLAIMVNLTIAQEAEKPKNKRYFIHQDIVKPGKVAEYEAAIKSVLAVLNEHKMTDLAHAVLQNDNMEYIYVYEFEKWADFDNSPWSKLEEKMGKKAFDAMWEPYEDTYVSHKNFITTLQTELSYTPENSGDMEEGNFRHWEFYHVNPDKGDEARAISKEWHALYASKKVPTAYRIYRGGLGTEMPTYVVVTSAKNAADFEADRQKTMELLGEEGKALNDKTMAITNRFRQVNGWFRPDLSYLPKAEEMTAK